MGVVVGKLVFITFFMVHYTYCAFSDNTPSLLRQLVFILLSTLALAGQNVVFIVSDDMRPDINAYYQGEDPPTPTHPPMRTPNLDALASRALLFKRAYVQYSMGSPSRNSFWTSRRPDSLRCYDEYCYWRRDVGDLLTLPQYFKNHGYTSLGFGKLFQEGEAASGNSDPPSWSKPIYWPPTDYGFYRNQFYSPTMLVHQGTEEKQPLPDRLTVDHAIDALRNLAPQARTGEQPFFIAIGLLKPTHPFQFPEFFNQHYNTDDIPLPLNKYIAKDVPQCAWHEPYLQDTYETFQLLNLEKGFNRTFPDFLIREMRAGYYKSLSFCDSMVGRVLDELKAQGLEDNTIIVFVGDHGYHLGEQAMWTDQSNFEVALRAPMIIRAPGFTDQGAITTSIVEFVDLFPTVVDLAELPAVPFCSNGPQADILCSEGASMLPLFHNPKGRFKTSAFSQYKRSPKLMGYTIRIPTFRYTEWVSFADNKPQWGNLVGVELYDHTSDPHEMVNRATDESYVQTSNKLSKMLHEGWRAPAIEAHNKTVRFREELKRKKREEEEARAKAEAEAIAQAEAEARAIAEEAKAAEEARIKVEEEARLRAEAEAVAKAEAEAKEREKASQREAEAKQEKEESAFQNIQSLQKEDYFKDSMDENKQHEAYPDSGGKSAAHMVADHIDNNPLLISMVLWVSGAIIVFKWMAKFRKYKLLKWGWFVKYQ